jgi:hypothetical protein
MVALPDETLLPAGTTTIVDAGGSNWRSFGEFRRTVIAPSKTRVLALINIVGKGMVPSAACPPHFTDQVALIFQLPSIQPLARLLPKNRDLPQLQFRFSQNIFAPSFADSTAFNPIPAPPNHSFSPGFARFVC